ncbi:hypothetical protein T484DRAFT_2289653 [Baffinella frigidus]|nr:hypothetical protein T484DRAFT_2289653 [Cryptophyta sp. CCMP2293]
MAPLVVYVAKWTQPDYKEQAKRDNRVQLLTIPYSHYNEAARWALSKAKVPTFPARGTSFGTARACTRACQGAERGRGSPAPIRGPECCPNTPVLTNLQNPSQHAASLPESCENKCR